MNKKEWAEEMNKLSELGRQWLPILYVQKVIEEIYKDTFVSNSEQEEEQ